MIFFIKRGIIDVKGRFYETAENANLMTQSKGVVIVNYKELKKI